MAASRGRDDELVSTVTRNGVSAERALAAVFRAISDEMPDAFRDLYLNRPARTGSAARLARVRGARSPN
jgi:hypothetical protein